MDQRINLSRMLSAQSFLPQDPVDRAVTQKMSEMLGQSTETRFHKETHPAAPPHTPIPAHLSSLVPSLIGLKMQILDELENNVIRLLSLNPSRREAIAQRLDRLAGGGRLSDDPAGGG